MEKKIEVVGMRELDAIILNNQELPGGRNHLDYIDTVGILCVCPLCKKRILENSPDGSGLYCPNPGCDFKLIEFEI